MDHAKGPAAGRTSDLTEDQAENLTLKAEELVAGAREYASRLGLDETAAEAAALTVLHSAYAMAVADSVPNRGGAFCLIALARAVDLCTRQIREAIPYFLINRSMGGAR